MDNFFAELTSLKTNISLFVSGIGHFAVAIAFLSTLKTTDCDSVTESPAKTPEYPRIGAEVPESGAEFTRNGFQRDGLSNEVPEPELLPVLHANGTRCRISEYQCENKRCVPINRFCDGSNDCGDSSDEPRHCTRKSSFILSIVFFIRFLSIFIDFQPFTYRMNLQKGAKLVVKSRKPFFSFKFISGSVIKLSIFILILFFRYLYSVL